MNKVHHFADRLIEAVKAKNSPVCVGLDPHYKLIPAFLKKKYAKELKDPFKIGAKAILEFNKEIIDAIYELVPVVKPQIAFYELWGAPGVEAYIETVQYAQSKGLLVISDAKRSDIGSTSLAYAKAQIGENREADKEMPVYGADAVTVNGYLGYDGIKPFTDECATYGKGIFILVKTSNPSSSDLQNLDVTEKSIPLYELMAQYVDSWGSDLVGESGYSCVGAVVGATYPEEAQTLREVMPQAIFLVPGYGAQGATAKDCAPNFNEGILGAVVNSSRGITFAYSKSDSFTENDFAVAAREAVVAMNQDLVENIG